MAFGGTSIMLQPAMSRRNERRKADAKRAPRQGCCYPSFVGGPGGLPQDSNSVTTNVPA